MAVSDQHAPPSPPSFVSFIPFVSSVSPSGGVRRPADNPFRVDRVLTLRYRADLDAVVARFAALGHRAALVGPHGSGKSTLREDLGRRLDRDGWTVRTIGLHADEPLPPRATWRELAAFQAAGARHLVAIDGAEQLGPWRWWRLRRRLAGPLLITTHRPGRLPTLHHHAVDPTLLRSLVADLVGPADAARLGPRCDALFAHHRGNLRDCLRALYDDWAEGPSSQ